MYSTYKKQQLLTESWRKFLKENQGTVEVVGGDGNYTGKIHLNGEDITKEAIYAVEQAFADSLGIDGPEQYAESGEEFYPQQELAIKENAEEFSKLKGYEFKADAKDLERKAKYEEELKKNSNPKSEKIETVSGQPSHININNRKTSLTVAEVASHCGLNAGPFKNYDNDRNRGFKEIYKNLIKKGVKFELSVMREDIAIAKQLAQYIAKRHNAKFIHNTEY